MPPGDEIVEFPCQGDVTECDVYAGLFAWRYGHIPEDSKKEVVTINHLKDIPGLNRSADETEGDI